MTIRFRNGRTKKRGPVSVKELIQEAEVYDKLYLDVVVHSVDLYDADNRDQIIHEFLSYKNRGAFKVTNPHSKRLWLAELLQAYLRVHAGSAKRSRDFDFEIDQACAFVTLTHRAWACADTNIQFDLDRAKQMVRNALRGTDYIAVLDAGMYKNEDWETDGETGKLISFHFHALVWAKTRTDLDRLRKYIKPRFEPILGNKSSAHFKFINNQDEAATALTYMAKMPFLGYRTTINEKGKKKQVSCSKLFYKTRWHLFNELQKHDLFTFWLAGGSGALVLKTARDNCKQNYKPHKAVPKGRAVRTGLHSAVHHRP